MSSIKASVIESSVERDASTESELSVLFNKALQELPEAQRRSFEMNRFNDMTYEDIAGETGVSVKTVEYRISQAIRKLRIALKDYLDV